MQTKYNNALSNILLRFQFYLTNTYIVAGYHNRINRLAGQQPSLWKLLVVLQNECEESLKELTLVKLSTSTRCQNQRYIKYDKAIRAAFNNFEQSKDIKALLRFAGHAAQHGLAALEDSI